MNLVLKKEKYILGRIGINFGGFGEQLNLFQIFGEHKQNTFRELRQNVSGIWGDQSIIFREPLSQGARTPPGGLDDASMTFRVTDSIIRRITF